MSMTLKHEPLGLIECTQVYRKEAMEELQQLQRSIEAQKDEFQETKAKESSLFEAVLFFPFPKKKLVHQRIA